jgi:hypothetical protein
MLSAAVVTGFLDRLWVDYQKRYLISSAVVTGFLG